MTFRDFDNYFTDDGDSPNENCSGCGQSFDRDEMVEDDGDYYCQECYDEQEVECEECWCEVPRSALFYNEDLDAYVCEDCSTKKFSNKDLEKALEIMRANKGWIDPYEFSEEHQEMFLYLLEKEVGETK